MTPPSGPTADKIRLLQVTAGNVRQSHLYVSSHKDFFPLDCIGGPRRSPNGAAIEIQLDGLERTVRTDIGRDAKSGGPHGFLRGREWVRQFFKHHGITPGTFVALERLSEREYRLSVPQSRQATPLTCAEFFAGIGLVRLALERQGWNVVFANDIDPKKAEMYRQNWPNDDQLVVGDVHAIDAGKLLKNNLGCWSRSRAAYCVSKKSR